jgi:hypothetical protein
MMVWVCFSDDICEFKDSCVATCVLNASLKQ